MLNQNTHKSSDNLNVRMHSKSPLRKTLLPEESLSCWNTTIKEEEASLKVVNPDLICQIMAAINSNGSNLNNYEIYSCKGCGSIIFSKNKKVSFISFWPKIIFHIQKLNLPLGTYHLFFQFSDDTHHEIFRGQIQLWNFATCFFAQYFET